MLERECVLECVCVLERALSLSNTHRCKKLLQLRECVLCVLVRCLSLCLSVSQLLTVVAERECVVCVRERESEQERLSTL